MLATDTEKSCHCSKSNAIDLDRTPIPVCFLPDGSLMSTPEESPLHFETQCIHGGVHKDQQYNSVTTPIYPTSTFYWNSLESNSGYDYTRSGNPTRPISPEKASSANLKRCR